MATASIRSTGVSPTMSDRQKILAAIGVSLLLHLLGFLGGGLWLATHGNDQSLKELKVVEVAVSTPTPTPDHIYPMLSKPEPPPAIDSDGLKKSEKAPEKPVFQSDQNSVAGSLVSGTGNIPLPSQDGRTDLPGLAFETKKHSLGDGESTVAEPPVMEFAPAPPVVVPFQTRPISTPVPQPRVTPRPTPVPEPTVEPTPAPAEPMTAPSATPVPTPGDEPLYKPTPVPSATPLATPDLARPTPMATPRPVESVAMLATPAPRTQRSQPPKKPGYQSETQKTKIEGAISNRAEQGVDALNTPLGRYRKRMATAIGSRWMRYMDERNDLINAGTVRISFYINATGQVEDLKVISNEGNETLANFTIQAITASKLPPLTEELAPALDNGRLEVIYSFTIYH